MEDNKGLRRIPLGIVATLATIVLASGGAAAWFTWRSLNPTSPPTADFPTLESKPDTSSSIDSPEANTGSKVPSDTGTPAKEPGQQPTTTTQPAELSSQVYWLKDVDGRLSLSSETIPITAEDSADARLKATLDALLSKTGDPEQSAFTTIPEKTQLLDASVHEDGVHINLSSEFASGGGSASMTGRLGQIIYTATAQNPSAPVWISINGKPLTLLGGEGLEVSQPMTREEFNQAFGF